jgi:hypothetical protein
MCLVFAESEGCTQNTPYFTPFGSMRVIWKGHSLLPQMKKPTFQSISMSSPAIYRIRVRGKLDAEIARRLDGLNLTEEPASGETPISVLVGRVIDQAALSGLLNSLYELHLPLISVDCLDAEMVTNPN